MDASTDLGEEAACARWLFDLRWGERFACRVCGHGKASQLAKRPRVWSCHACRGQNSVTAGTCLHRSKVPLAKVVIAAEEMAKAQSISGRALERLLGVSHETAWALLHRLRAGLVRAPTVLEGTVVATDVATEFRQLDKALYPVILVAADQVGRVVTRVTGDRWFEALRLSSGGRANAEFKWVSHHPVALWIATVLHFVHDRVSVRWVDRYVGALAAIQTASAEGRDRRTAVLACAMRCPSRGFAVDQRPPRNLWDPSWKAQAWPLNPVVLERAELPLSLYRRLDLRYGWLAGREDR